MTICNVISNVDDPDILYLIMRNEPQLFEKIFHQNIPRDFVKHFVKATTLSLETFLDFEIFNVQHARMSNITLDLWKLFKMINIDYIFRNFVNQILFDQVRQKLVIQTKPISNLMTIRLRGGPKNVDFSQIPSFLTKIKIVSDSNCFQSINLSSIDTSTSCNLQSLVIHIKNGSIILPEYALPSTLISLEIRGLSNHINNAKITDYEHLWCIGGHIEYLSIRESIKMQKSDFVGFDNMINLQCMDSNFHSAAIQYAKQQMLLSGNYGFLSIMDRESESDSDSTGDSFATYGCGETESVDDKMWRYMAGLLFFIIITIFSALFYLLLTNNI